MVHFSEVHTIRINFYHRLRPRVSASANHLFLRPTEPCWRIRHGPKWPCPSPSLLLSYPCSRYASNIVSSNAHRAWDHVDRKSSRTQICQHLRNYTEPSFQRFIIRIIFLVGPHALLKTPMHALTRMASGRCHRTLWHRPLPFIIGTTQSTMKRPVIATKHGW